MSERAKLAAKTPEAKRDNSASQTKKTNFSHSISNLSPINQILLLQRTVGNQAVQRLLRSGVIQTKLTIGQPGDIHEQEADGVAEQIMRMSYSDVSGISKGNTQVQRKCAECSGGHGLCSGCAEEETIQRKPIYSTITPMIRRQSKSTEEEEIISRKEAQVETPEVTSGLESRTHGIKGGGQPLPKTVRDFFEPRFGYDFSGVRIHTGSHATESAKRINALAYTVGRDIVFGEGQYAPKSDGGRRLLAHELTHIVQQNSRAHLRGAVIQCQKGQPKPASGKAKKPTAADAPKLELKSSLNGKPCACVVFVHNNERNARLTAELMHKHCSYNLAIVQPDNKQRDVKIPRVGTKDPNALFPPDIAKECTDNEQSCRDFLKDKSDTTDKAEIEKFAHIQFFLSIKDCSNSLSLPVIALHNNAVEDTAKYREKKDKVGVDDLKMDVDKIRKRDEDPVKKLKDLIDKKFGTKKFKVKAGGKEKEVTIREYMTETEGKTNIFRWCAVNELSKCHIGDPHHPDNIIWVTNEKDFELLSKKDVNVALQSDLSKVKGTESEKDLSTLFLVLKEIFGEQLDNLIVEIMGDIKDMNDIPLWDWFRLAVVILARTNLETPRFLNIETPGTTLKQQTDAERIRNYEFIVDVLKAVGLHCCGDDAAKAEKGIKEGLKIEESK